jgi:hypothetical protein
MENTLKQIADNPALFEAVKEVMRKEFKLDDISPDLSEREIGETAKARLLGKKLLERGFEDIERHKTPTVTPNEDMPAR